MTPEPTMLKLVPMTEDQFSTFATHSIAGYAQDIRQTCGQSLQFAMSEARDSFMQLLPDGLGTPDHYLFQLYSARHEDLGVLWFGIESGQDEPTLFIYELEIHPTLRRRGHATQALEAAQAWARARGIKRIELNVFAHNQSALALYGAAGFKPSEMTLCKNLEG